MERDSLSWRHLFALLITGAAIYGAFHLPQAVRPAEPLRQPVMHIRMMEPPPPPPPPQPVKQIPAKTVLPAPKPKVAPAPVTDEPNPTIAAPLPASVPPATPAPPPSAPITAPSASSANTNASLEAVYGARLRGAIEVQKHYPTSKDAMIQQPRGAVSVWVVIDRQGTLVDAGIDQSHGSILNQAALQSVRRATYPAFPADLYPGQAQHRFVVSLDYSPQ